MTAERACPIPVQECGACEWSGGNRVGQPCVKCGGEVIERPCRRAPILGGKVCPAHGGSAPQTRAAANRRLAELEAAKVLAELEVVPIGDPLKALLDVAAEIVAGKDRLAAIVATLEQLRADQSKWGSEQVRAEVQLYERMLDRTVRVLDVIARLNLDERMVRLEEAQLDVLAAIVRGFLRRRGLDPDAVDVQADLEAVFIEIQEANDG